MPHTLQYRPRQGPFSFSSRDLPRLTTQTKAANCQRLAASAMQFYEKNFPKRIEETCADYERSIIFELNQEK